MFVRYLSTDNGRVDPFYWIDVSHNSLKKLKKMAMELETSKNILKFTNITILKKTKWYWFSHNAFFHILNYHGIPRRSDYGSPKSSYEY